MPVHKVADFKREDKNEEHLRRMAEASMTNGATLPQALPIAAIIRKRWQRFKQDTDDEAIPRKIGGTEKSKERRDKKRGNTGSK